MAHEVRSKDDLSLGELFADLTQETATLVRQEVSLAKTELSQKASRIGKEAVFLAAGGIVAYAGLLAIIAGIIIGLAAAGMALWASALLVGFIIVAVGGGLVWKGLQAIKRVDLAPTATVETVKEDIEWAKEQTR